MISIFKEYPTNKNDKTRLDIFVHGFCKIYQKVFFYIRVSYSHTIVFKICNNAIIQTKKMAKQQGMNIEHRTFTLIVFSSNF